MNINISLSIGCFINTFDDSYLGKIINISGNIVEVEFFHSITNSLNKTYRLNEIKRAKLWDHTRVYIPLVNNMWRIGRVINHQREINVDGTITYEIQFPNNDFEYFNEKDLYVRCLNSKTEPSDVLAYGGMETQFFHDHRQNLKDKITEMRAKSSGMTALLSSPIDLIPHQVEVVRRVLTDPIQRYLLADEVGMGKTIEAGIIIRQCLLDDSENTVLVLVPDLLVSQWENELRNKLALGNFMDNIYILPFVADTMDYPGSIDMLVIDEVHNLFRPDSKFNNTFIEKIRKMSYDAPRLLLLSATPILGHESILLSMLNLLDPQKYLLNDLDSFRKKIEEVQKYGNFLFGLREDASEFVIKQRISRARELFSDDENVQEIVDNLNKYLKDPDERINYVRDLRNYISETYRLHHRLVRTRRIDTQGWEFTPRGPKEKTFNVILETDEDTRLESLINCIEEWRLLAQESLTDSNKIILCKRYVEMFEALGCSVDELSRSLEKLKKEVKDSKISFDGENTLFERMEEIIENQSDDYIKFDMARLILENMKKKIMSGKLDKKPKIVVFISSTIEAKGFYQYLKTCYKGNEVSQLFIEDDIEINKTALFEASKESWVLITDQFGEEGQNLHFCHAILHYDLPFSASRIEQRIGRLDRFGRTKDVIQHNILLPFNIEETPWASWYELLEKGFKIFNEPISDIQFLLEKLEDDMKLEAFLKGTDGLLNMVEFIVEKVIEERKKLNEQYELEITALSDGSGHNIYKQIEEMEDKEEEIQKAFDTWLFEVLRFWRDPKEYNGNPFRLNKARKTLLPEEPWNSEIFNKSLKSRLSYKRKDIYRYSNFELIRPGSNLCEGLEKLLRWDDRGSSFSTLRYLPKWENKSWIGFKLYYLVEGNLALFKENIQEFEFPSIKRKSDFLFPPFTTTIYIDLNLEEVLEPETLQVLKYPYEKGLMSMTKLPYQDLNLGSKRHILESMIGQQQFIKLCSEARKKSESILLNSKKFQDQVSVATAQASAMLEQRNKQIIRRRKIEETFNAGCIDHTLELEVKINRLLLESVSKPKVRLDSIGFFIITGELSEDLLNAESQ